MTEKKGVEPVRKITMKGLGAVPKPDDYEIGQIKPVATVYGRADGYKTDTSNYGDYKKFKGEFEAVRASDGHVQIASALIMPDVFADMLSAAVDRSADGAGVEFAIIVCIRGVEKRDGTKGYEWAIETVRTPTRSDSLAALRQETVAAVAALPAPQEKEAEKAPASKSHAKK